jgi:tripartite-type tricarboxylate transporter receptor subunit TctC
MPVAAVIPWKVILHALPTLVVTAKELWSHWSSRPRTGPLDPKADVHAQLASVAERLAALESAETEQTKLFSQMAEQLQGVAHRAAVAYWLGLCGLVLSCIALLLAIIPIARAQTFPSRPVTLVVPFAAGGPVDVVARVLAEPMRKSLGQAVVVDNTTGAGGSIGVGRVARAAPDGYTVSIGHWSTHVVNGAVYSLQYDLLKDLEPVAMIGANPMLIVGKPAMPATDLRELIAWVKANQEKVNVGTAGPGSGTHISGVYFQNVIGASLQFIPYKGSAPALQDLVGGQIDVMVDQMSNSMPQVRGGKIKAYAITAQTRSAAAPDIPTVDEAGLPGFHMSIWYGTWVPRGTPKEAVARLQGAIADALADATVRQRLADLGLEIVPPAQQTPAALGAYQKAEIEKWWPIIKAASIKVD